MCRLVLMADIINCLRVFAEVVGTRLHINTHSGKDIQRQFSIIRQLSSGGGGGDGKKIVVGGTMSGLLACFDSNDVNN